jgi:Bacterial protein of unknown function (DUF899)/Glycosyl transferase family 21
MRDSVRSTRSDRTALEELNKFQAFPLALEHPVDNPKISARLLFGDDVLWANPRLNNLSKGWRSARYAWIAMSDSNVAADIKRKAALKILGRSSVERQLVFAQERGWRNLDFVQTVGDDFARDIGALTPEGDESPALIVFRRVGDSVRLFWAAEMSGRMADPGQDPRGAPERAPLWNILDLTPQDREPRWYPKLTY